MSYEKLRLREAEVVLGKVAAADNGTALWLEERRRVQAGELDDRPLYWRRLTLPDDPTWLANSRNYQPVFRHDVDFRVLVTGFDPFNLDEHIDQSNPSGVIALSLDQVALESQGKTAEIRSFIVPVRFADFDRALIERLIEPLLDTLDLLLTLSMGGVRIDLERFPGLRRSSDRHDNDKLLGGGTEQVPVIPPGLMGPEFVEFSLPAEIMREVLGDFEIKDNRTVTTLERGEISVDNLEALANQRSVQGSGGGYLSNEISYRTIRKVAGRFPVGHIHTASITGFEPVKIRKIVDQVTKMIVVAIGTLSGNWQA